MAVALARLTPIDASPGQPIVAMRDVVETFETAAGSFQALCGVSLDVYPGEFVAITGRSGSGKSTLINMLTGVDRPTSGQVFAGKYPTRWSPGGCTGIPAASQS